MAASTACELDLAPIIRARQPTFYVFGGRSNPAFFAVMADRLGAARLDFTLDVLEHRDHFDPPHPPEPEAFRSPLAAFLSRDRG